ASQAGNSNWNVAANVPQTLNVQARDTDGDGVTDVMELADGTLINDATSFNSLSKGLVAYYPFSGNANDASGNGFHLSVTGATPCPDRLGATNRSYLFDGNDSMLTSGRISEVENLSHTLVLWVKASDPNQASLVGVVSDTATPGNTGYQLMVRTNSKFGFLQGRLAAGDLAPNSSWKYAEENQATSGLGEWRQLVGIRSNGVAMIYVNGVLQTNTTTLEPFFDGNSRIRVGYDGFVYARANLDEIRFYNRALSQKELLSLYQAEAGPLLPVITSTNSFLGKVGVSSNWTVTASGSTPITFRGTNLPVGLSLATNGVISGTPTTAGTNSTILTWMRAALP
ncbi:MAG: LamG domain-containing protein, partial [Verrucomicrobia bacterium]|nr:LamG domain-containing protein [Verrucomicrobiota bacterium]